MIIINSHSINPVFKGATIEKEFRKYGKIGISFFVHNKRIGVDVEGFASTDAYVFEPKNNLQKISNEYFVARYIDNCYNAEELKSIFKIK